MSHQMLTSLDLDDLTPRQLRKILNGVARSQLPYAKKSKEEQEKDVEKGIEENDALMKLKEEKNGDSKPPKVLASDLTGKEKADESDDGAESKKKTTKKAKA